MPAAAALGIAAAIAGLAVAVSLAWGSELVAALGLVGAALAPGLQALDSGIGAPAVAFAVVVLAATAFVAVVRRWELLLAVVLGVVGAQAAWLVAAKAPAADAATLAVVAALALVTLTAACAWQVTGGERAVSRLAGPIVLADLGFVLSLRARLSWPPAPIAASVSRSPRWRSGRMARAARGAARPRARSRRGRAGARGRRRREPRLR